MYNIIFIVVFTVLTSTVNGCPTVCICFDSKIVYCRSRYIMAVPSDIPLSTVGLSLDNNQITNLDKNVFRNLTALEQLWLRGNQMTTLDGNLFQSMTSLQRLRLEDNPLDCLNCELEQIKIFLQNHTNLGNAGARCEGQLLISHSFTNCKESDTTPDAVQTSTPTNHQRSTVDSTTGIIDIDVIIYISSGAAIFLVVICSFVGFCVRKKYQSAYINQNLGNDQQINLNAHANVDDTVSTSQNNPTRRGSDMEYEEMNEIEMSDFFWTPTGQENTTADDNSNDSSEGIQLPTGDYLNPYTSLLPSRQQQTQEDSDDSGESRPYTNLYEPLQQNRQEESSAYARCASIVCEEVVDEPI
ncbi:Hypothetical predicted protein [Mytilus galloprovincialis]|uniref:LRRNT domain-containing protein n=1 Tax=Mytilus galloprovincialis TaxID=29158 RepID=A0A8B6CI15_MYTGA|nr:Hypothetical predicted protein [Mytilus galloprovincialis]